MKDRHINIFHREGDGGGDNRAAEIWERRGLLPARRAEGKFGDSAVRLDPVEDALLISTTRHPSFEYATLWPRDRWRGGGSNMKREDVEKIELGKPDEWGKFGGEADALPCYRSTKPP